VNIPRVSQEITDEDPTLHDSRLFFSTKILQTCPSLFDSSRQKLKKIWFIIYAESRNSILIARYWQDFA